MSVVCLIHYIIDILDTTQLTVLIIVKLITDGAIGQSVVSQNLDKIEEKPVSAFMVQAYLQASSSITQLQIN